MEIKIGVVGYSTQKFDQHLAVGIIARAFDRVVYRYPGKSFAVVSGYTDLGIPSLAYREAISREWRTVGVACDKANEYETFPVDEVIIVGHNWGDESDTFLGMIDVLVKVGGGNQSAAEYQKAKDMGKLVVEYDLPVKGE